MRPKRLRVIGDPIAHSLSPVMHRAAFRALDLPHEYEPLRVTKDELPSVLDRVRRGEFHGLNVTVPHKIEAMRLCDVHTDEVARTGAVNTVYLDATGRLVGSNTDVDGLRTDLLAHGVPCGRALVLGTGGAARAAMAALATLADRVVVAGRDGAAARALAAAVGVGEATDWDLAHPPTMPFEPFDVIVNATSAGMAGGPDGAPIADAWTRAPKTEGAVAYDLVYRAPHGAARTPFLERAAGDGHRAIDGLGMLVEQGARALSIFLGSPITAAAKAAMRDAVLVAKR